MDTLLKKEWREHFKVAVIGFALLSFFLALSYWNSVWFYRQVAAGQTIWGNADAQPLLSGMTLAILCVLCPMFGGFLGWLQIHSEHHRDLWAFLVHRPVTRTEIFFSKMTAGLGLYAAGMGLPLLIFIILVWWPGHFAVPFEWAMATPIVALFLNGIVFYFAGLLTGLRQARWYATRGLGLAAAILMTIAVMNVPVFGISLVLILVSAIIMAAAACGSFNSHGAYEGQPLWNQRALVITLMAGCFAVVMLAVIAGLFLTQTSKTRQLEQIDYQMMRDGTIYRTTTRSDSLAVNHQTEITDLKGSPLKDKATGHPITSKELSRLTAPSLSVPLNFNAKPPRTRAYHPYGFFYLWRRTPDTLWYWERNGRLWAYDISSRKLIGSLGPNGFKPGVSSGFDRFFVPMGVSPYGVSYNSAPPTRTLITSTAVYKLDLENRACSIFYESSNDEQIVGAADCSASEGGSQNDTIVVTKSFVRLMNPDANCVWQTPFKPEYPAYNGVAVFFLEPTNRFAVWIDHSPADKKRPTHVVWLSENGNTLMSTNVPANQYIWKPLKYEKVITVFVPPAFFFIAPLLNGDLHMYRVMPWQDIEISFGAAAVCAVAGWVLGRRHCFSAGQQAKWAAFHLFFGLPGVLALLCAPNWPTRVPCPHCKRLRAVDRDQCEHCGAEFAPPARLGTEIFEMVER